MTGLVERLRAAIDEAEHEARERIGVFPNPSVHDNGALQRRRSAGEE
ncbi:hypothetical protein [Umezawaea tangerina]|uniref:Uncharacterized protein n=1 Tax=Umezawaea tangerina TaxID=84725 RepID=A0A2T0SPU7_9PSEU|nr:hypothetical protein [Umezawaea tangerina]PRY35383.1 hypothetical protein CLV43_114301 [Umezawaea tangerina]